MSALRHCTQLTELVGKDLIDGIPWNEFFGMLNELKSLKALDLTGILINSTETIQLCTTALQSLLVRNKKLKKLVLDDCVHLLSTEMIHFIAANCSLDELRIKGFNGDIDCLFMAMPNLKLSRYLN
jgi:hypothetical protein